MNQNQDLRGGEPPTLFDDDLVKFYFEYATEVNDGMQPPKTLRQRFVKAIKAAIDDKQRPEVIRRAIMRSVDEALSPASFDEVMWKIQREIASGESPDDRALLARFLEAQGVRWPTGSRFVWSPVGGTYKEDVLGCDRPPYEVPWGRPSRDAVIAALKALDAAGVDFTVRGVRAPRGVS